MGVKIGIIGGTGSGKTTYLASLRISALLGESGGWRIDGLDDICEGSELFLSDMTETLLTGSFPGATSGTGKDLAFMVSGTLTQAIASRIVGLMGISDQLTSATLKRFKMARPVNFPLYFRDQPGVVFYETKETHDKLWKHLADCTGLIYLYDYTTDAKSRYNNYLSLQKPTGFLFQELNRQGRLIEKKLHHHVAVCVTKFDDPTVYERLNSADLVEMRYDGVPFVSDANSAFHTLADPLTVNTIKNYFHEENTHYFVTSSIGFYKSSDGSIDPIREPNTEIVTENGERKLIIRGEIKPINVFDPLAWLEHSIFSK